MSYNNSNIPTCRRIRKKWARRPIHRRILQGKWKLYEQIEAMPIKFSNTLPHLPYTFSYDVESIQMVYFFVFKFDTITIVIFIKCILCLKLLESLFLEAIHCPGRCFSFLHSHHLVHWWLLTVYRHTILTNSLGTDS